MIYRPIRFLGQNDTFFDFWLPSQNSESLLEILKIQYWLSRWRLLSRSESEYMPLSEVMWWFDYHQEQIKSKDNNNNGLEKAAQRWQLTKSGDKNKKKPTHEKTIRERRMELIERRSIKKNKE